MMAMPEQLLLVEDSAGDALLLQKMLESRHPRQYATVRVATLEEAKAVVRKQRFEAVLLDLSLPDSRDWRPSAGWWRPPRTCRLWRSLARPMRPWHGKPCAARARLSAQGPGRRRNHRPGNPLRYRSQADGGGTSRSSENWRRRTRSCKRANGAWKPAATSPSGSGRKMRWNSERNLLRTLIDNLPDCVYIKDAERRFIAANLATARIMGAHTQRSLGKNR